MDTVLLTGGAGFIGSHLADMYLERGHRVVVIDNLSTGKRKNVPRDCLLYQMDVEDPELMEVFQTHRPSIVNHHAAQINVRVSMENPILDATSNIIGILNLLRCCREFPPEHFIFASSGGAIYGDDVSVPTSETENPHPSSPYGIAKLASELYLECFQREYGISFAALRYGNVYGPRQNPHGEAGVVAIFYNSLLKGTTPVINGDGNQTRDYVYVRDVVKVNHVVTKNRIRGVFNVGTGIGTSVNNLASLLLSTLDRSGEVLPHGPKKPGEQLVSVLDARKVLSLPGENHKWTPLPEGLKNTLCAFRESSDHD